MYIAQLVHQLVQNPHDIADLDVIWSTGIAGVSKFIIHPQEMVLKSENTFSITESYKLLGRKTKGGRF